MIRLFLPLALLAACTGSGERGIRHVVICGLARDFCVKWSAGDAVADGFRATVLWDLTRPVDPRSDARVRSDLEAAGLAIVRGERLAV